jgi:DNA-binding transcriptional ArsR family regulator
LYLFSDAGERRTFAGFDLFPYFDYYRNMETQDAVAALAALAQESRLTVFRLLIHAGPAGMAAGKISDVTGIPPSSLSFHLKELAYAGMVTSRQEGRFVIYAASFSTAGDLVAFLTENCCGGNPCMSVQDPLCATATTTTKRNRREHQNLERPRSVHR